MALLFAPKSGKETRRLIARRAEEGKDFVVSKGRELQRQGEALVEKGRENITKHKERLAGALQAGREALRETFTT